MTEHKSFRSSDFSFGDFTLRNVGGFLAAYLVIAVLCICIGLFLEILPQFWRGVLLGGGLALIAAFRMFGPKPQQIDVAALPHPSAEVKAKCDDPNCSLVEAVKAYRDQTGLGLSEAKAVVDSYRANKPHLE